MGRRKKVLFAGALMLAGVFVSFFVRNSEERRAAPVCAESQKLILYTAHKPEVYLPIVREFEEQSGIWTEVHAGGTTEMLNRIREDDPFGEVDVMFGGGVENLETCRDFFSPYACAANDKLEAAFLSKDGIWTPFTELPLVFIYNNKLVMEADAPRSWREFLDGSWTGQISFANPERSGTSFTILETMKAVTGLSSEEVTKQFCRALSGDVASGSGEVILDVESGRKAVGITLEESALKAMAQGKDISMCYPEEGTSAVPDGAAIALHAPHRENAEAFLDFITGRAVQTYAVSELFRRSVRSDVREEGRVSFSRISFDMERTAKEEEQMLFLFREQMGGRDD